MEGHCMFSFKKWNIYRVVLKVDFIHLLVSHGSREIFSPTQPFFLFAEKWEMCTYLLDK